MPDSLATSMLIRCSRITHHIGGRGRGRLSARSAPTRARTALASTSRGGVPHAGQLRAIWMSCSGMSTAARRPDRAPPGRSIWVTSPARRPVRPRRVGASLLGRVLRLVRMMNASFRDSTRMYASTSMTPALDIGFIGHVITAHRAVVGTDRSFRSRCPAEIKRSPASTAGRVGYAVHLLDSAASLPAGRSDGVGLHVHRVSGWHWPDDFPDATMSQVSTSAG